jgi:cob(I)alamin adenosyltransferase
MSDQDLRHMITLASEGCELSFNQTGIVAPTWYAITAVGALLELPVPHLDKDIAAAMVRAYFKLHDVVRYVFVTEAWTVSQSNVEDVEALVKKIEERGAAAHPDRVEVVIIAGEDRDAGELIAHRRIVRPRQGRAYLAPLEMLEKAIESRGRMVGLLPAHGTRH